MLPVFLIVVDQVLYLEAYSRLNFPILSFFKHPLQTLVKIFQINHALSFRGLFHHLILSLLLIFLSVFRLLLPLVTTLIDLVLSQ